jgi:hypothetical protein
MESCFKGLDLLPQPLDVVQKYLDGSMISLADGVHLLLFFPRAATLRVQP